MLFLPRLLHHLPIPEFPLILGVSRFLAFLLVTVFLPIAPADEEVSASASCFGTEMQAKIERHTSSADSAAVGFLL